ncbi:DNA-binding GntR family transcriptional regulator [Murinocardiopsis flavida]|uniref:DNA-binding GntR family transcriptional regulator n=1 Tax=Murinocardiopsis flavida TaxID=645275 RepID=A0A2P8DQK2_9ACTN|nr:GntR family transcriptional regulator [Murinocardiopsis flavida]PSK99509.1 DNA-binding GntR family transcriptional regulator [Murinocardiopsis flavida]
MNLSAPSAAPKASATDRAYTHTKDAILGRRYEGGAIVSEGDIAADVGVSRTPVREALLRLQAEGLVRLYPKRGALIVPVSRQEVDDVIETRRLVEGYTVERAAAGDLAGRAALAGRLTGLLEAMEDGLAAGDTTAFVHADREFHRTIVAAAGNDILNALYESLRDRQYRMMRAGSRDADLMRRNIAEHAAILDAVRRGVAEDAAAAVRTHLDHAAASIGGRP